MKLFLVLVVLSLAAGIGSVSAAAPDPVPGRGLYFVNLASNTAGTETWFHYELRSGGAPAVSNVEIVACTRRLLKTIVQTPDGVSVEVREGNITIETPTMGDLESKQIILVMEGSGWSALPTSYTLKAGQIVVNGETYGPKCTPTAVTLSNLAADVRNDGETLRNLVLGLLMIAVCGCAVLMLRGV
jgi:hypothetical protein